MTVKGGMSPPPHIVILSAAKDPQMHCHPERSEGPPKGTVILSAAKELVLAATKENIILLLSKIRVDN